MERSQSEWNDHDQTSSDQGSVFPSDSPCGWHGATRGLWGFSEQTWGKKAIRISKQHSIQIYLGIKRARPWIRDCDESYERQIWEGSDITLVVHDEVLGMPLPYPDRTKRCRSLFLIVVQSELEQKSAFINELPFRISQVIEAESETVSCPWSSFEKESHIVTFPGVFLLLHVIISLRKCHIIDDDYDDLGWLSLVRVYKVTTTISGDLDIARPETSFLSSCLV